MEDGNGCRNTYSFEIGLEVRHDLLYSPFNKDSSYHPEAFSPRVFLQLLYEGSEHQTKGSSSVRR